MDALAMAARARRRCSKCGTMMKYLALGEFRCPACGNEEMDDYGKIRKYLDAHGTASAAEIETATGVRRSVINDYLKKGRLEITDGSSVFLKCEICGRDIRFGRVCQNCGKNLVTKQNDKVLPEEIGDEPTHTTPKNSGKMRF